MQKSKIKISHWDAFGKRMKRLFRVILFLVAGTGMHVLLLPAQETIENPIRVSGLVFDVNSLIPLPGAHYYKINRRTGGITNSGGRFQTSVRPDDSIVISFIGYKNHLLVIADTLAPGDYIIGIPLSRDTAMISEVLILPRIKNLKQDFLATPAVPDVALNNAKQNLRVSTAQGVAGKGIPFDADMSYEIQKRKLEIRAMNKGMIAPDQMVSLSFLMVLPYVIYKLNEGNAEPTPRSIFISDKEIQEIYNRYRNTFYKAGKSKERR